MSKNKRTFLFSFFLIFILFVPLESFAETGEILWTGKHNQVIDSKTTDRIITSKYRIPYTVINGTIMNFVGYYEIVENRGPSFYLTAEINGTNTEGIFSYKIPKSYPFANNPMYVLTDPLTSALGIEINNQTTHEFDILDGECYYEIAVPITQGKQDFLQYFAINLAFDDKTLPFREQATPQHCIDETAGPEYVEMYNLRGKLVKVFVESVDKLIQRGYIIE